MNRIVVGVDGSPGAQVALQWALKLAEDTGAELEVVHAWEVNYAWIDGYAAGLEDWARDAKRAAQACVDQAVSDTIGTRPEYANVTRLAVEGRPAKVLLDRSKAADVLVVGSRGRGGFTGLLLGSVSQQCVHHSRVPVVVVPEPE
jgi:nucleotide-binding universal stress UspA family protein